MKLNPIEEWLADKDQQLFEYGKELAKEAVSVFFQNVSTHGLELLVRILPDIVGYSALVTGGLIMVSTLAGRGMMKPLGIFAGVIIIATSILEVT